jgi:hypothetical protein
LVWYPLIRILSPEYRLFPPFFAESMAALITVIRSL